MEMKEAKTVYKSFLRANEILEEAKCQLLPDPANCIKTKYPTIPQPNIVQVFEKLLEPSTDSIKNQGQVSVPALTTTVPTYICIHEDSAYIMRAHRIMDNTCRMHCTVHEQYFRCTVLLRCNTCTVYALYRYFLHYHACAIQTMHNEKHCICAVRVLTSQYRFALFEGSVFGHHLLHYVFAGGD